MLVKTSLFLPSPAEIHRLIPAHCIASNGRIGFLITRKASDARLPISRVMRRTICHAAVMRDEGNAADDVLMADQGPAEGIDTIAFLFYSAGASLIRQPADDI
jgi:hypothetical protein